MERKEGSQTDKQTCLSARTRINGDKNGKMTVIKRKKREDGYKQDWVIISSLFSSLPLCAK